MKKKKYYNGPGGVFYNQRINYMFILQETPMSIYDIKKNKIVGKIYNIETLEGKWKSIGICGIDGKNVFRLGDLWARKKFQKK